MLPFDGEAYVQWLMLILTYVTQGKGNSDYLDPRVLWGMPEA